MTNIEKKKLIVLTGPTAVGKTDLSVKLAARINGEIVSADSVQVYKHMDIGSAKVTEEEMKEIPHHLISVLEPTDNFDIVRFKKMADQAIKGVYERNKIPILSGGTGFYIQAVLYDVDFTDNGEHTEIRKQLQDIADEKGPDALHEMLAKVDPESASIIHANNVRKVIRALEFYKLTGERISDHNKKERESESPYDFYYFVLNRPRKELYERINKRVDIMMENGLEEEVRKLLSAGVTRNNTSMQAIGYKEIAAFIDNECSLEDAVTQIKTASRHYAKRQITWFKRERNVTWINLDEYKDEDEILEHIISLIGPLDQR